MRQTFHEADRALSVSFYGKKVIDHRCCSARDTWTKVHAAIFYWFAFCSQILTPHIWVTTGKALCKPLESAQQMQSIRARVAADAHKSQPLSGKLEVLAQGELGAQAMRAKANLVLESSRSWLKES